MKVPFVRPGLALLLFAATTSASAQTFPTNDPVIRNMWDQGMGPGSQVERLAQVLTEGEADAALIASMVHFLGFTIPGIKADLAAAGIRVRLETGN